MNISVTTIGDNWTIVPELIGFLSPCSFDFFCNHPDNPQILNLHNTHIKSPPDQLWVITTSGQRVDKAIDTLMQWADMVKLSLPIKIIKASGIEDIFQVEESRKIRDLILRVVIRARNLTGTAGKLTLSLAGGRKTMSADMQFAATIFGCDALVHIMDRGIPQEFRSVKAENLIMPPHKAVASCFMPLVIGQYRQNPVASFINTSDMMHFEDKSAITEAECSTMLLDQVESIMNSAHNYLYNFSDPDYEKESSNYKGILVLSPEKISLLRSTLIGVDITKKDQEISFLKKLPKPELHCHFGGCLSIDEIIEIAELHESDVMQYEEHLGEFRKHWKNYILNDPKCLVNETHKQYNGNFFKHIRTHFPHVPEPYTICAFILLFKNHPDILEQVVFGRCLNEPDFSSIGISAYEGLGDIQGSSLLQTEKAIKKAMKFLINKLLSDNVKYVELRCSPVNYTRGGLSEQSVFDIIASELDNVKDRIKSGILFIASRHGRLSDVYRHIELMESIISRGNRYADLLLGFDLAGNENVKSPSQLREAFLPVMDKCMNITIHAGETAPADSIWQAVYSLNAERIGHGLKLNENPNLKKKFLDRGIAIEMCPSSNFQIKGFRDNYYPQQTEQFEQYPLKDYLDYGLKVTVNTDNMGISRTSLSNEYLKAARLSKKGLSIMDILQLVKNGFNTSFASFETKKRLIIDSEKEILNILGTEF